MKKIVFILLVLFLHLTTTNTSAQKLETNGFVISCETLRIATYNIRVITKSDNGANSWENRKKFVAQIIQLKKFDVCGVQEIANKKQKKDLIGLLPDYSIFSKGRDNTSGAKGEQIGILYNKNRFAAKEKNFFFLSPTPDVVSKGWDAALNRVCIWIKLYDKITKKSFYIFNVHFDHLGINARSESAKLVIKKIKEIAGNNFVFCVGDFNASPSEAEVNQAMTSYLNDSKEISAILPIGSPGTFNGWDMSSSTFPENNKIDYIYCKNVQVLSYSVLNNKFVDESYPSDHFPVMITCILK